MGEFAPIKQAIDTISSNFEHVMKSTQGASEQISKNSTEDYNHSNLLANGAIEQSQYIETLVTNVDYIKEKVLISVKNKKSANVQTTTVSHEIDKSREYMNKMVDAMNKIYVSSG